MEQVTSKIIWKRTKKIEPEVLNSCLFAEMLENVSRTVFEELGYNQVFSRTVFGNWKNSEITWFLVGQYSYPMKKTRK